MSDSTRQLRDTLAMRAVELSQRVLDRMYENPFWMERYGARGRQFANEDSLHHVRYLDQALAADDPGVFERYACWLRSVLVSRGMCSEHLAANFRLLAEAIAGAGLPDADRARAILERGVGALTYTDGEAGRLEARRDALLQAVANAGAPGVRDDDRRYLVSYWIDRAAGQGAIGFEEFAARFDPRVVDALTTSATSR